MTTTSPLVEQTIPWRAFDGYPYLVTYLVPAFYHIMLLPAHWPVERLERLTSHQAALNGLRTCLVLAPDSCTYYSDHDGSVTCTGSQPLASCWTAFQLMPFERSRETAAGAKRRARLRPFLAEAARTHLMHGDATKRGRRATPSDLLRLGGYHGPGVPRGLFPCPACRELRGECLDPNPKFRGWVMPVHCRCAARNRCARCGTLFHDRKLNANYYNPVNGGIWHVPALAALSHRCVRSGV